jgi:transcriptional regulator with XRE-family HTH domain
LGVLKYARAVPKAKKKSRKKQAGPGPGKLRAVWDAKARALGLTQLKAAHALGYSSQASVSQYLNGEIPLNLDAAYKFADLLEVDFVDIWEKNLPGAAVAMSEAFSPSAFSKYVNSLSPEEKLIAARILIEAANNEMNSPG